MDTIYNHVHQLHNLNASTEYELTIQSRNMFGWSHALTTKFTTLQTGKSRPSPVLSNSVSQSKTTRRDS